MPLDLTAKHNLSSLGAGLQGVIEQVQQRLLQAVRIVCNGRHALLQFGHYCYCMPRSLFPGNHQDFMNKIINSALSAIADLTVW